MISHNFVERILFLKSAHRERLNLNLHFQNSNPETLVILPPLTISNDEIRQFLNATSQIFKTGFLRSNLEVRPAKPVEFLSIFPPSA